jgi:peptidoglycan hydrolase-like protein with peptidoglycan-binding domain
LTGDPPAGGSRAAHRSTVLLLVTVALSSIAALAIALVPRTPPEGIVGGPVSEYVPIVRETFADARQVRIVQDVGDAHVISMPRDGTLTSSCRAGQRLTSGQVVLSVDGQPVLGLATRLPMWRDLEMGSRGEDVEALQQELDRLGLPTPTDGRVGAATLRSVQTLRDRASDRPPSPSFLRSESVWLPSPTAVVDSCSVPTGTTAAAAAPFATLVPPTQELRVEPLPDDLTAGPRTLRIGSIVEAVTADGRVTDPAAISRLLATRSFRAPEEGGAPSAAAVLSLRTGVAVAAVPAAAVGGSTASNETCVAADTSSPVGVDVVSSSLGRSFVQFRREPWPDRVLVRAPVELPCP